jgi:serine/threonine-protein kinase HipA
MRKGRVFFKDIQAGIIAEEPEKYTFQYSDDYITNGNPPISISLPLDQKQYESDTLFSFFDGLIPEGWLLDIAEKNWKINPRDRMGLLLACCKDTIGAVTVERIDEDV